MTTKKRGLGRGLDALLGATGNVKADTKDTAKSALSQDGALTHVPVEFIQRGKYQPRMDIDPASLEELSASIKAQGVMQPIVIRPIKANHYEIIAGERRWRAAQMAGLDKVPAIVREVADEAAIAMALIENIQREDLNPIEEARALSRLQEEFELTQQEVAEAVGKSRTAVTNLLRLMNLEEEVKTLLERGDLDMGHARALLSLEAQLQTEVARKVVADSLTVRQTEALVKKILSGEETKPSPSKTVDPDIMRLEENLAKRLGSPVKINHGNKGKGKLTISYSSLDELDGILSHLK
ncbi:ParB/RepB/Spo0J family partition protein [Litoribrevibacter euphylliae]|uniref:Probable chromosome-partitioning protein ParB n=1 Tax=Litoribrevibacter euphylliae TaxID=1834034 RepID=A0ABV7HMZ0_9GAMM